MDNFGITEETAGQISKLMVSADRYDHPGCSWHTWGDPRPQGGPPQPLEKKCREGHLVVKNGIMLHELNFMGSTPPSHGLDPSCVEHGGQASRYIKYTKKFQGVAPGINFPIAKKICESA